MRVKDLKALLENVSDEAFVARYSLAGKPYMILVEETSDNEYSITSIDASLLNMYSTKDMLKQLKEIESNK